MLKKIATRLLLPGELATIITRIINTIKEKAIENPHVLLLIATLEEDQEILNNNLTAIRTNALVDDVFLADVKRDNYFKGFRDRVASYRHDKEDKQLYPAYEKIWAVIEKAGTRLYALGYADQSGRLDAMIKALDTPPMQQAIKTLNITKKYNNMKQAQADFAAIYNEWLNTDKEKQAYPTLQEAKRLAIPHLRYLIDTLRFLQKQEPATYNDLNQKLNEIITDVISTAKARKTRKDSSKEELMIEDEDNFDMAAE